jgi:hypothetical protein
MQERPRKELPLPDSIGLITPSRINPWRGAREPGARWTWGQIHQLRERHYDPETIEGIMVRSVVTPREMWWPTTDQAPVYVFECPIIARRHDGRLLVLSPAGMAKWVHPDGHIVKETHP